MVDSTLSTKFSEASKAVLLLEARPSNETLLAPYALYKQATEGDVSGKRPGMLDLKGRKKYDAWAAHKGLTTDDAMERYIALVHSIRS